MENETDKYLEAARIVAECKPSKLPYVLAILREGGINIEEDAKVPPIKNIKGASKNAKWLEQKRKQHIPEEWRDTNDAVITAMREAFMSGISVTRFAEVSGIHRTNVYRFLEAGKPLTEYSRERIINGLRELGFWNNDEEV